MPLKIVFLRPKIGLDSNPITKALLPPSRGFSGFGKKGQFPLGKRGAKATQNGNHDVVHV